MDREALREHICFAARRGETALIRELVEELGAAYVRLDGDPDELATLHHAAASGSDELVAYLLSNAVQADPRCLRNNAFSALHASAMNGHTSVCALLLDAGADINAQTQPQGYAPLHSAAFGGHLEAVRLLLERGADPTLLNYRGETPSATASRTGQSDVVMFLAEASGA